jgi:uncharacterized protein involved in type VI secretion and phage assembly
MPIDELVREIVDARAPIGYGGRFYGAYPAVVKDVADPDGQGRVRISLPWSPDGSNTGYEAWARLATLMAGSSRGTWFIPDVNDEVLVIFAAGNPAMPFVVGGLWNGQDAPPQSMDGSGKNDIKQIKSRNGVAITLDDASGQEKLIIETPGGNKVSLTDGPGVVEIADSNGNSVKLEASGITVTASAKVTVNASMATISASMLTVDAGMSKFSGVVQADTVICNSIISSSYTPGAGNIW